MTDPITNSPEMKKVDPPTTHPMEMKKVDPPTTEVKRGPGRPPNQPPQIGVTPPGQSSKPVNKADENPSIAGGIRPKEGDVKGVNITYRPQPGDPVVTTWNGHTFHANKPTEVKHTGMIAQARTNAWFDVEGDFHRETTGPQADNAVPSDSEGYRRYAIEWFRAAQSAAGMKSRWDAEESLRQSCGVGTDDLEYLDKLYGPRYAELLKAES
jgi:hypothetical protein